MVISDQHFGKKKQSGLALLVLMLVLVLTFSVYYFSSISIARHKLDTLEKTPTALKRAKQALLDYALTNWRIAGQAGKIGKLPCPDYMGSGPDGEQDGNCGNAYANAIGYFPWRTLGIDVAQDSSDSCLIYAVSPAYKASPVAALNPDSYGQFRVVDKDGVTIIQGASPETRPVAVIIAPGPALQGQSRQIDNPPPPGRPPVCGSYYSDNVADLVAAYLDDAGTTNNAAIDPGNDNVIEALVSRYAGSDDGANPLNDRLVSISHEEYWGAMQGTISSIAFNNRMENLTEAIALCFANYGLNNGKHLPMPAPLNLNWGDYRKSVDYDDGNDFTAGFAGRLPYTVANANTQLGNSDDNNIYNNAYCDGLELSSTVGLDNIRFSDDSGGDDGEYFDLWSNWKDHFFYAVSKAYNPSAAVAACSAVPPAPLADCVSVNGAEYAAIVIFSGLKLAGQQRYTRPFDGALAVDAIDDKDDTFNYLENGNDASFPDNSGNASYSPVTLPSNDIMFCIKPDMSVVECL